MPQVGFIALQGMMDTEWPLDARPPHTPIPTPALQSSVVGGAIGGAHLEMEPPGASRPPTHALCQSSGSLLVLSSSWGRVKERKGRILQEEKSIFRLLGKKSFIRLFVGVVDGATEASRVGDSEDNEQ